MKFNNGRLPRSTYILITCGFSKGQRSQDSEFREIISDVNIFTVSLDVSFYHGAAGAALFFQISWSSFKTSKKFLFVHLMQNVLLIGESPKFRSYITSKICWPTWFILNDSFCITTSKICNSSRSGFRIDEFLVSFRFSIGYNFLCHRFLIDIAHLYPANTCRKR